MVRSLRGGSGGGGRGVPLRGGSGGGGVPPFSKFDYECLAPDK